MPAVSYVSTRFSLYESSKPYRHLRQPPNQRRVIVSPHVLPVFAAVVAWHHFPPQSSERAAATDPRPWPLDPRYASRVQCLTPLRNRCASCWLNGSSAPSNATLHICDGCCSHAVQYVLGWCILSWSYLPLLCALIAMVSHCFCIDFALMRTVV